MGIIEGILCIAGMYYYGSDMGIYHGNVSWKCITVGMVWEVIMGKCRECIVVKCIYWDVQYHGIMYYCGNGMGMK